MSAQLERERFEFAPPPTPGLLRSFGLAILAHGLLLGILTAGVAWKRAPEIATVSAELWSAIPQQAAAPAAETPPVEPPPLPAEPQAAKPPEPEPPPAPDTRKADADIALAKKKAQEEKEKELRLEKLEQEKKAKQAKEKLEKEKALKAQEKLDKERLDKERAEKERLSKEKLAKEKAAKAQEAKEAKEAKAMEELRQQNLKRMAGLAGGGGSGNANSTGTAMQDSGPSAGYAGRIVARIKPNIVFTETIPGNPRVEVEIRTASSGAILSARVTQSSGVKSWDEAVLRAIEKTEMLPKDTDGRVPTSMQIGFRPKD